MRKPSLTVVKDNTKVLEAAVQELIDNYVLVGIPADSKDNERQDEQPDYTVDKDGTTRTTATEKQPTNALIGFVMEFGSPARNIPARPTLFPGVRAAQPQTVKRLRAAAVHAIEGNHAGCIDNLRAAGMEASSSVKNKIDSNVPPELSEKTLAARRRRGVTRTDTLVDTGQFRNSITYVVVNNNEREEPGS